MLVLMWILKILLRVPIHLTQPLRLFPVWLPLQGSACALCVLCVCSSLIWSAWPRHKIKHKINKKLSKHITKIVHFGTHFESILGVVGTHFETIWGPGRYKLHASNMHTLIFYIFGGFSPEMGSPMGTHFECFLGVVFRTFLESPFFVFLGKQVPKMRPKRGPFLRPWTSLKCSK